MRLPLLAMAGAAALLAPLANAQTGKIVVNNDEWTMGDPGFGGARDPDVFGVNVCDWFTGGGPGSFLAYSNNFGLTGGQIAAAITGAGHGWTVQTAGALSLAQMQAYDGIFLGGALVPATPDLIAYVNGGGNVYVMGGTGVGGAVFEAAQWNPFLNNYGLGFGTFYNGVSGDIPISSAHPIFAGVDTLFQNNGQDVLDLQPANPKNLILVDQNGHGLYGVYVPAPGAAGLLAMAGLVTTRRRRR